MCIPLRSATVPELPGLPAGESSRVREMWISIFPNCKDYTTTLLIIQLVFFAGLFSGLEKFSGGLLLRRGPAAAGKAGPSQVNLHRPAFSVIAVGGNCQWMPKGSQRQVLIFLRLHDVQGDQKRDPQDSCHSKAKEQCQGCRACPGDQTSE